MKPSPRKLQPKPPAGPAGKPRTTTTQLSSSGALPQMQEGDPSLPLIDMQRKPEEIVPRDIFDGSVSERNSSRSQPSLPTIGVGSRRDSLSKSVRSPLSPRSAAVVTMPQIAAAITPPPTQRFGGFPMNGGRRSSKKGKSAPKPVAAVIPQPTVRDVVIISNFWIVARARLFVRRHRPSEFAERHAQDYKAARLKHIHSARQVIDRFIVSCANKLRKVVDNKRLAKLGRISTLVGAFARSCQSQLIVRYRSQHQLGRSCLLLLRYWRRSEQYRRREVLLVDRDAQQQCCAEEDLDRREVVRRERLEFLNVLREVSSNPFHTTYAFDKWEDWQRSSMQSLGPRDNNLTLSLTMQSFSRGDWMSTSMAQTPSRQRRLNRFQSRVQAKMQHGTTPKSLRKNAQLVHRLSLDGTINLDMLLGGSQPGATTPISHSPTTRANAHNTSSFGGVVAESPMLREFAAKDAASDTTRSQALADARAQLFNRHFLYPLKNKHSSLSSSYKKLCVSEVFLGETWASWFVSTQFQTTAAAEHTPTPKYRRSVMVRKKIGGVHLEAQKRLSTAQRQHRKDSTVVSSLSSHGSLTPFERFSSRRSSTAHLRPAFASQKHAPTANPIAYFDDATMKSDGAVSTNRGLALRGDSTLFSIDAEMERLLVQEFYQRMQTMNQEVRLVRVIAQQIESERMNELADLVVPASDRVHDRNVPQEEMFLFGGR